MTPRERVLRTFRFEQTDRAAFDLMESTVWDELLDYFRANHGLEEIDQVVEFLDPDFRWIPLEYQGPAGEPAGADAAEQQNPTYSRHVAKGPLAGARTVADVEAHPWPDPAWTVPADYAQRRRQWPNHALVFLAPWRPLFWGACTAFGMEEALIKMHGEPALFDAFVRRQNEFYMDVLKRGLAAARGHCDICWLADDLASQKAMIMGPDLWRKRIKPHFAEQVRLAREHGMFVLFHSCGAVREILPDLIDVGVSALLVFQTTAAGMDAESIAAEFGGRLAFYGGIDVQQLLSYGTVEQVRDRVRANVRAFADCGGYIVANSHHCVATIKGENIVAMCQAARDCT